MPTSYSFDKSSGKIKRMPKDTRDISAATNLMTASTRESNRYSSDEQRAIWNTKQVQQQLAEYKKPQSKDYQYYSPTLYNNNALRARVTEKYFKDEMASRGIVNRYNSGWDAEFSRIPIIDPYMAPKGTTEYLFFVKPDLHLLDNGSINPELNRRSSFFADAIDRYPHIVDQLQYSASSNRAGGVLSPLLSNAVCSKLDMPSISAEQITTPQNVYGTSLEYRGSSFKSDEGYDFSLEFKDTKYLEIYMYFKMYDEYEKLKWMGQVTPTSLMYIYRKNLHDQTAIYKFIVGEDGMTLLYWARVMGVFPTSVPRDSFSDLQPGEIKHTVQFHGQFVRDMDPLILRDFNNINMPYIQGNRNMPLYDQQYHRFDGKFAKCPYIGTQTGNNSLNKLNKYYLLWAAPDGFGSGNTIGSTNGYTKGKTITQQIST